MEELGIGTLPGHNVNGQCSSVTLQLRTTPSTSYNEKKLRYHGIYLFFFNVVPFFHDPSHFKNSKTF